MERDGSGGGASVLRPLLWFAAAGLLVVAVLGLAATAIVRSSARREAVRNAKEVTRLAGAGIAAPAIGERLLAGDPAARRRFGAEIEGRVRRDPVVRVKLWSLDGRILWSDESRLDGKRYRLDGEELKAVRRGLVEAQISDLGRPENRYERRFGKLLEVYMPIRAPDGTRLLFEDYLRFSSVSASQQRILGRFFPALIGALLLLWAAQLPLAWSLAQRLRARRREREALLARALDASDGERRRIAQDLHDGVLQELAGTAFSLAATGDRLEREGDGSAARAVREAAGAMRAAIRDLRGVLVGIHPPRLRRSGLRAVLDDLVAPLSSEGMDVRLHVDGEGPLSRHSEELLFRGAQEALRNVAKHAGASVVEVDVRRRNGVAVLSVCDDGRGFDSSADSPGGAGHLGLRLLGDLADERGARLSVESRAGEGTRVILEVPA